VSCHVDGETLHLFLHDDSTLREEERSIVQAHLDECASCSEQLDLMRFDDMLRKNSDVVAFVARDDRRRAILRQTLLTACDNADLDYAVADDFLAELLSRPFESWDEMLARYPSQRTAAMAQRILREVDREMNREPIHALRLISVAESIGSHIAESQALPVLVDVWRQRANAYRHLYQFHDSLTAADLSAQLAAKLTTSDYEIGQAYYTSAGTLFKMTEYAACLQKLELALPLLRRYKLTLPYVKALMLKATTHIEQGSIETGIAEYREILPLLQQLGDKTEEARILANMGECHLRLAHYDQAIDDALRAIERYEILHMNAEAVRSSWTLHLARLLRGDEDAIDQLHITAAAFEVLGMLGDAGFVRLDITEELLRLEDWEHAEPIARALVDLFTRAGVTLAKVQAIDQLRRAVELREATPDFVRQLRTYMQADDSQQPFIAPRPN
jgi:tetratricopeptide (TPR) repeat protein